MATQKRNGKTVGIYIDEHDYDVYSGLGLRDRKRVLEAARKALLAALSAEPEKVKDRPVAEVGPAPVVEVVQTVPVVPVAEIHPDPVIVDTPAIAEESTPVRETLAAEEKPAAISDTPDTGLKGFLDAGW